jgi:hypothetical protein
MIVHQRADGRRLLRDFLRAGVLSVLICTLTGCIGEGRQLTAQQECVRAGGVWLYSGCEHSAGGGGGGGGGGGM